MGEGRGEGHLLDELQAYDLLAALGIPHAPAEALERNAASTAIDYPVAVKILSAQVPHKTEAGGVVLGVRDAAGLREAIARIGASVEAKMPQVKARRFLVQSMARGLGEALVGYRHDAQVGPIVMLAAGGVLAEIHRDRAIRMAPVDLEGAREMVAEVKAFAALRAYRGGAAGDLEALARAVVALSNLARATEPVIEAEVNPLLVLEEGRGVLAVDALVRMA